MAKIGNETRVILMLILKLAEERVNKEIDKSVDAQNKASEYTNTQEAYEFFRGKIDGLRYAIDCFGKVIAEIEK